MNCKQLVEKLTLGEKVRLCTGLNNWQTVAFPHLGIPSLVMSDGTSGVRFQKDSTQPRQAENLYEALVNFSFDSEAALANTHRATCFPSGAALACSWNAPLAAEIGKAVGKECKRLGIGLLLGPGMNIRRHPLTARNFEYYSEDPVLSGEMAAGMVNGIQAEGVGATLKHFICNNSDTRRTKLNCLVEERALREIYLAGYERAIQKAKPAAIMGSYPAINGKQACENPWLLQDVLRGEWGFEGVTLSDWGAVKNSAHAAAFGLDLQMPSSEQYRQQVLEAVQSGSLEEEILDRHCTRILELVLRYSRAGKEAPEVDFESHHSLAQKAAAECAVLLKNKDDLLPLNTQKPLRLAVLGEAASRPIFQGTGCAVVNARRVDIPLEELRNALPKAEIRYAPGYLADYTTTEELLAQAAEAARWADVALVVVGSRLPGESDEYDRPNMALESGHEKLAEAVCAAQPNTAIAVCSGDAVAMPWAQDARAILAMWYAGEGCGEALAALISGNTNPSGKLAVTIPKRLQDTPAYLDFPHEGDICRYREGVFAGYRWYDARQTEPLYPFGHGLSYTTFQYQSLRVKALPNGEWEALVQLCNTGACTGQEVVQLYVAPKNAQILRPEQELKAFVKLELAPGESREVALRLNRRDFAWYNSAAHRWQVDAGSYEIRVGASSRGQALCAEIQLTGDAPAAAPLTADSHYTDLFCHSAATKVYFAFLVRQGLLREDQVSETLQTELEKTFWGFSQHLDMLAGGTLHPAALRELLQEMNDAIAKAEGAAAP